jgi:hypothetical protein
MNNPNPLGSQTANGDSSRTYGWDNSRAYLGISNMTLGTLTVGRQYALTNDASANYDPFGGALQKPGRIEGVSAINLSEGACAYGSSRQRSTFHSIACFEATISTAKLDWRVHFAVGNGAKS